MRRLRASLFAILVCILSSCTTGRLKPFETDGCSMCPDGSWRDCCVTHDIAYWRGGTMVERWDADIQLYQCVRERTNFLWAGIMFVGVRIGGFPYWPFPWRWGFGWGFPKGYGRLSPDEAIRADELLNAEASQVGMSDHLKSKAMTLP